MCKHINNNNIIEFAIFIKFNKYMVIMIINYQHLIYISGMTFHIFIKMLN